jgi:hypothetical protein
MSGDDDPGFAHHAVIAMEAFILAFLVCFGIIIGLGLALDRWESGRRYVRR